MAPFPSRVPFSPSGERDSMAYKEKDTTKKWPAQWLEITVKGEKKRQGKIGFETKKF